MCTARLQELRIQWRMKGMKFLPSWCLHLTNWYSLCARYHASTLGHTRNTSCPWTLQFSGIRNKNTYKDNRRQEVICVIDRKRDDFFRWGWGKQKIRAFLFMSHTTFKNYANFLLGFLVVSCYMTCQNQTSYMYFQDLLWGLLRQGSLTIYCECRTRNGRRKHCIVQRFKVRMGSNETITQGSVPLN